MQQKRDLLIIFLSLTYEVLLLFSERFLGCSVEKLFANLSKCYLIKQSRQKIVMFTLLVFCLDC